ncbi:MAG: hypothetical protein RR192_00130 [Peptostreptococcaceae bacterium]
MTKSESLISIKDRRRRALIDFMINRSGNAVLRSDIYSFYEDLDNTLKGNKPSVSDSTISRDLRKCEIRCDKENGNTYLLNNDFYIRKAKVRISIELDKSIIYKPLVLASSLKHDDYDNPSLKLFSIVIKSTLSDTKDSIDLLHSSILELYSYYNDIILDEFRINKGRNYLEFVFDDKKKMKDFYNLINGLKSKSENNN